MDKAGYENKYQEQLYRHDLEKWDKKSSTKDIIARAIDLIDKHPHFVQHSLQAIERSAVIAKFQPKDVVGLIRKIPNSYWGEHTKDEIAAKSEAMIERLWEMGNTTPENLAVAHKIEYAQFISRFSVSQMAMNWAKRQWGTEKIQQYCYHIAPVAMELAMKNDHHETLLDQVMDILTPDTRVVGGYSWVGLWANIIVESNKRIASTYSNKSKVLDKLKTWGCPLDAYVRYEAKPIDALEYIAQNVHDLSKSVQKNIQQEGIDLLLQADVPWQHLEKKVHKHTWDMIQHSPRAKRDRLLELLDQKQEATPTDVRVKPKI